MLNLLLVGFPNTEFLFVQQLAKSIQSLRVLNIHSSGDVLATTERGPTVAVVYWLTEASTEAELEQVQRLTLLKIPCVVVASPAFPSRARLSCFDDGFMGVVSSQSIATRLIPLLEMFLGRANIMSSYLNTKVEKTRESGLFFNSPQIRELLARLDRVAALGSTILLTGETGVGKSSIARWIHNQSARASAPFVDVPCGALPENLVESELFGHVRGSFTSADRDQVGKFKVAGKGTLLLDEIDCLPLEVQSKLLKVVERHEFEPVGSTVSEKAEARLIVTTNRPLEIEVAEGRFRQDLYYRLGVLSFRVPPLRERDNAILPLAEMFLKEFATQHKRPLCRFSSPVIDALSKHSWPGNIRELHNAIEYSVAVCAGEEIQLCDLPESIRNANPSHKPRGANFVDSSTIPSRIGHSVLNRLTEVRGQTEREVVLSTLRKNGNNRSRTAIELGISRVTLYKKLNRLDIGHSLTG